MPERYRRAPHRTRQAITFALGAASRPSATSAVAVPRSVSPVSGMRDGSLTTTPAGHHAGKRVSVVSPS